MGDPVRVLLRHGAIVTCIGVLAGVPFWLAILREAGTDRIRAWRVAHVTLIATGFLLLIVALICPSLYLGQTAVAMTAAALVVSAYGFVFALGVGAWAGVRGLSPVPVGINTLFFLGHAVGASGAIAGMGFVLYGLLR